ncbi:MAG: N-acetylmuramoyl-L-alanine amidase [Verrucomicrobiales bacterium]|nr:N-acetylmuramoyl-L-alanine amidase [Verrucomicrobiales bacterium]
MFVSVPVQQQKMEAASAEWKLISYRGLKYVSAANVKSFYRFTAIEERGKKLIFKSPNLEMEWEINSKDIYINKVKFVMSFAVIKPTHRAIVSVVDLAKLIDPILRPSYIKHVSSFDTVVIDAGHGDHDSGAVGLLGYEKKYCLDTALRLERALKKRGFKTHMTRRTDKYLSLGQRVREANSVKNAIFISVHFNSSDNRLANGIETYALAPQGTVSTNGGRAGGYRKGNNRDGENIALATAVHAMAMHRMGVEDRGVKRARFNVLTGINKPAILFEGGFVTHSGDAQRINSWEYREKLANTIAEAVSAFRKAVGKKK